VRSGEIEEAEGPPQRQRLRHVRVHVIRVALGIDDESTPPRCWTAWDRVRARQVADLPRSQDHRDARHAVIVCFGMVEVAALVLTNRQRCRGRPGSTAMKVLSPPPARRPDPTASAHDGIASESRSQVEPGLLPSGSAATLNSPRPCLLVDPAPCVIHQAWCNHIWAMRLMPTSPSSAHGPGSRSSDDPVAHAPGNAGPRVHAASRTLGSHRPITEDR